MPKTLLLADDSVTIQKVVGISLANEDIELVSVDNGDDAVTKAQETRPDIVLADIVMPGKNGYEVCEAIKSDPAIAQTPVLLLTGTFEAFDAERARQAGADGHITKPFEAQALVDQVNQLLARSTPLSPDAGAKIDAAPTTPGPAGAAKAESTGDAFDFFAGAATPSPEESSPFGGADIMADSQPGLAPGHTDETVLLDGTQASGDPAFDAAVEAAAFDAPGERPAAPYADPGDSGFDIETADLSMASTVPQVTPPAADLTFSEVAPPSGPAVVTDLDAAPPIAETPPPDETPAPAPEGPILETPAPIVEAPAPVVAPPAPPPTAASGPPSASPDATDPLVSFDMGVRADGDETVLDPAAAHSFDVEPSAAENADATVVVEDGDPARVQAPADLAAAPTPVLETEATADGAPALSPAFQQQVHTALEKIAWEAFSDLSEQVVKQALARVEAIAWEVIPQMAETLIQEEIQRMKDGGEE